MTVRDTPTRKHVVAPAAAPAVTDGTAPAPRSAFRPDIEGLRAIAVGLVVLFHAGVPILPGGYVGVDVFFVISGYLITRLLVGEFLRTGHISLSRFYLRRARRLLPALTLVIAATLTAGALLLPPLTAAESARDGAWASVYLANFRFIHVGLDYLASDRMVSPFLHLWSLAVEEQFYLFWPLLLLLVMRSHRHGGAPSSTPTRRATVVLALVAAGSFAASVALSGSHPVMSYYSPLTRVWELAIGGLLTLVAPALHRIPGSARSTMAWAGLGAIVFAGTTYSLSTVFPGAAAALPVRGTVCVTTGSRPGGSAERMLGLWPLQRIGLISYALYLWHWPLFVLAEQWHGSPLAPAARAGLVCLAVLLATASFHLVEHPLRRARVLVDRRALGAVVFLALTIVPAAVALRMTDLANVTGTGRPGHALDLGTPGELPQREVDLRLTRALQQGTTIRHVPRNLTPALGEVRGTGARVLFDHCHLPMDNVHATSPRCTYGDTSSRTAVVLLGDSHAAHWFPTFESLADHHHWRLVNLTKSSCPAMEMTVYMHRPTPYPACATWRDRSIARLAREHPSLVVVSNSAAYCTLDPTGCEHGLGRVLDDIHTAAPAAQVLVLEDAPRHVAGDVPDCVAAHLDDARACQGTVADSLLPKVSALTQHAADAHDATFQPTSQWFCTAERCPVIIGNMLMYRDSNHMTEAYARLLAPVIDRQVAGMVRSGSS